LIFARFNCSKYPFQVINNNLNDCNCDSTTADNSKPTLGVLIPYFNRTEHLATLIPVLKQRFQDQNIPFLIYVIEPVMSGRFNRGMLFNVGYELIKDKVDYLVYHDVDEAPLPGVDYGYPETPIVHLCVEQSRRNWTLAYQRYLGGVVLAKKELVEKVNGFSNEFWGWGKEDDDFYARMIFYEVFAEDQVPRPPPGRGRFLSFTEGHTERDVNEERRIIFKTKWKTEAGQQHSRCDGLSLLRTEPKAFELLDQTQTRHYTHFKVKLNRNIVELNKNVTSCKTTL
jgi:hypothetical protein